MDQIYQMECVCLPRTDIAASLDGERKRPDWGSSTGRRILFHQLLFSKRHFKLLLKHEGSTMRSLLVALAALVVSSSLSNAQLAPPDANRAARIRALIEWVNKAGRDDGITKEVAHELGWGESAVPGKRKAYENDRTHDVSIFYVVTEANGIERYVFAHKALGRNDIWDVAPSGAILNYLVFGLAAERQGVHPKDPNLSLLDEAADFLEVQMHKAGY